MMRKLLVPILVIIVVFQFVLLRVGRDDDTVSYPRVFVDNEAYVAEILDDDMEDDSVRAVKYRLELMPDEFGEWAIMNQSSTWACWPGRGHEDFSEEWCE